MLRLHPIKYFKFQEVTIFSKDSKILNLSDNITNKDIKDALRKIISGGPFYLKNRVTFAESSSKIYVTIMHERKRYFFKNGWQLTIKGQFCRITPAEFTNVNIKK